MARKPASNLFGSATSCSFLLWSAVVVLILFLSLAVPSVAAAKVRHFRWSVEYVLWSPDCDDDRAVIGINGQFPGPTIRAKVGDTIHVELTNRLGTEGVVIHWHGIRQVGSPWADGTAMISQCPIKPGENFTYRFKLDKAGTYFYHGHYGMQRSAGLYGSLIVDVAEGEKEPFHYDQEFNLLLSDWWHQSITQQEASLDAVPMRWIGEPQSLLINGRGQYNCSLAPGFTKYSSTTACKFKGREQCAPQILSVLPNKTYRLRLASTTALASLNLQIQNHKMLVVEADGNYVEPFEVEDLDIYSGESYSVLVTTDQSAATNYWVSFGVRAREPKTAPALTILHYVKTTASTSAPLIPTSPSPTTPLWNNFTHSKSFTKKLRSFNYSSSSSMFTKFTPNRRMILLNTQNMINGRVRWAINNVSLSLPTTPYLGSIKYNLKSAFDARPPPETYYPSSYDITIPPPNPNTTTGNAVYSFNQYDVVDLILQNANGLNPNSSETHPWHLHGHDFWVLGYGEGKFDATRDAHRLNLVVNPPLKNTAVLFPYGWTALRFVADNPGVWAFHCHIEPHLHMGMGVVFAVAVQRVKGRIPTNAMECGLTATDGDHHFVP